MTSEIKTCQNCKNQFVIEPEDFVFYEKMHVPPPTFCPECRMVRRMTWRNERTLYNRKDAFEHTLISIYNPDVKAVIYERDYWWSDKWDPLQSGRSYDFTRPFFLQFQDLLQSAPIPNVFANTVVNSPYANHVGYLKNCYLVFASWECENILYGEKIVQTKDSIDAYGLIKSELGYELIDCEQSHRLLFSRDCVQCTDSAFLYDCKNCSNCFGCIGLRNKEYYILNKPHAKEDYMAKIKEYDIGNYTMLQELKQKFLELCLGYPRRFAHLANTVNVVGNHCRDMKNCYSCFDLTGVEDSKYLYFGGLELKDSYDGYGVGVATELLYEGIDTGANGSKEKFSVVVYTSRDTDYCFNCENCSNLFGCIGLRNKQYCILNKQYSKEEFEKLLTRIIDHMDTMPYADRKGRIYRYGEFFPPDLSPFAYNETIAQEYFPLTKEAALEKGYSWKNPEERSYQITITTDHLPNHIKDVSDSILNETIECIHRGLCNEQCTVAFRIIPQELEFYKKINLSLPRLCPNCRHYERLAQRNPFKLWRRKCTCGGEKSANALYQNQSTHFHGPNPCPNEFETSYAPERPEIVYCEQCYQAEVV